MSEELAVYNTDQVNLIKQTVAKGCTDLELQLFMYQAQKTGLDPLSKQIHAIKRFDKKQNRETMTIQTGIDGYRLIADRTGKYAGNDDPVFGGGETYPSTATVTVWKMVDGVRCGFSASARWNEYFPGEKQGFMWEKLPFLMLGKCAEALALRKAFPAELSGIYTFEEMQQAGEDTKRPPMKEPQAKKQEAKEETEPEQPEDRQITKKITDPQRKRFYAIAKAAGKTDDQIKGYLKIALNIEHTRDIPVIMYDELCDWAAESKTVPEKTDV
uniref:Putative DNA recombination protein n=1 Tax=viral metagenome TaxID=1070528 RepID=A0A6M3JB18_9ZZZZ